MENGLNKQINVLTTHILDDDSDLNEMLQEVFHLNGLANFKFFEEADAFLEAFDDAVHICIIDYHLSGKLNGIDVARICRTRNKRCKIIFVSGIADPKVFAELINMKVDGFVSKNEEGYMHKVAEHVQRAVSELREQFAVEGLLINMRENIAERKARRTNGTSNTNSNW